MQDNNEIIELAGKEAHKMIENSNNDEFKNAMYFWNLKKRILKEKYNIDWKIPSEENRNTIYN